jgi:FkbM family methyltransferase
LPSSPFPIQRRGFAICLGPTNTWERLHEAAIGPESGKMTIHVSQRDDSSSLLPITALQERLFPGTAEADTRVVQVGPLEEIVLPDEIVPPALLKLDVQGYELEALKGCEDLLERCRHVYAECSFVECTLGRHWPMRSSPGWPGGVLF